MYLLLRAELLKLLFINPAVLYLFSSNSLSFTFCSWYLNYILSTLQVSVLAVITHASRDQILARCTL